MSAKRKILSVIRAATGTIVSIGELEVGHALKHFLIPQIKLLEVIEQVLLDPTKVFQESQSDDGKTFYLFYRLENRRYLVAVIKSIENQAHFVTLYPTGTKIKAKHMRMKRIKV